LNSCEAAERTRPGGRPSLRLNAPAVQAISSPAQANAIAVLGRSFIGTLGASSAIRSLLRKTDQDCNRVLRRNNTFGSPLCGMSLVD